MHNFFKGLIQGHHRTVKARKNIVASFLIQGINIIIGFVMVKLTLDYLDQTKYGIWLTLTSIIGWVSFFELGLGGGLKNRLAVSLAKKDFNLAKVYVSTTYAILTVIILIIALVFLIFNTFLDWTQVLNTEMRYANELNLVALIVFNFFFIKFVFSLINIILMADQRSAMAGSFSSIDKIISLLLVFALIHLTKDTPTAGSLIYLSWILSATPVFVLIIATIYFFRNDYKEITPSLKYVNFKYGKDLLSLGLKFFLIQFSMIIIFQSSNILIAQFFGPAEVTPYNLALKLFGIPMMIFSIVSSPFQVAFTEAWVLKDLVWIKKTVRNLFKIWIALVLVSIFLFIISNIFFNLWIGTEHMKKIIITETLKISLIVYFSLFSLGGVFNMFINGVAKVSVQMYSHIIGAIIFIPITYFFINVLNWGVESIVIGGIFANFYYPIMAPIQYFKIIGNKASGIWNK